MLMAVSRSRWTKSYNSSSAVVRHCEAALGFSAPREGFVPEQGKSQAPGSKPAEKPKRKYTGQTIASFGHKASATKPSWAARNHVWPIHPSEYGGVDWLL